MIEDTWRRKINRVIRLSSLFSMLFQSGNGPYGIGIGSSVAIGTTFSATKNLVALRQLIRAKKLKIPWFVGDARDFTDYL